MENILYGFEPRYTPPTRFPSRQIILRFEGGGQVGGRERERKRRRESLPRNDSFVVEYSKIGAN